ncbi:MAG: sigma-70 family RNA polymerase sigma factor [Turneriella sp.]
MQPTVVQIKIVHLSGALNLRHLGASVLMPMPEGNDHNIVRLILQGDKQAFATIYDAYAPRILGLAKKMLTDQSAAEDIVQETFLVLWRKAHLYTADKGALLTWLYRICRNLCLDRLKGVQNRRELSVSQDFIARDRESSHPDQDACSLSLRVSAALQSLNDQERELIEQAFFQGLSHRKIAQRTRIPLGTVKTRIASALRKLRHEIGGNWHAGEDF